MTEPDVPGTAHHATARSVVKGLIASALGRRTQRMRRLLSRMSALRRRLRRLEKIERLAGIGEYDFNLDTGELWWSTHSYRIFGLSPREGIDADRVAAHIHPDDLGIAMSSMRSVANCETRPEVSVRVIRPGGEQRRIVTTGELVTQGGERRVVGFMKDVTELDHARDRMRRAEAQYRLLFDDAPVPMWIVDRERHELLAVNAATEQMLGYGPGELTGRSDDCLLPQRTRVEGRAVAPPNWRTGAVFSCRRKQGGIVRVAVSVHETEFDDREAQLIAAQDVTERERTQERFSLIARATSDAVYDLDLETGAMWWSESFYTQFGYSPDSIEPSLGGWTVLVHPDDVDRVAAHMEKVLGSGQREWRDAYRLRRADGRYAEVSERGFVARGPRGHPLRMVAGIVDETDRRKQEADLRLLRRAVEATQNGVMIADARRPDVPIVYANAAFESMTGYSVAEIRGRNCRILQGDDRDQPGVDAIRQALRDGHEVRTQLRNYRKDGTLFWNEVYIGPVRDERGVVTHFVGILNDVSERHQFEEQLAHRATHDELTGLPNRVLLEDRLQQGLHQAARYGTGAAVVFIDLDDFKIVNDSLGHDTGDVLLREVARRLQSVVRDTDTVSRFGGDEFVAVLSSPTPGERPSEIISRMMDVLAEPLALGSVEHALTASIGYCCYPQDGDDVHTLLRRADLAMYQAKVSGRNRAVMYRDEFDSHASQRLQLVSHLREALERGEFDVHFQPQFAADGRALGLEALVRWRHPARGLLAPAEFIAACEDSGLIVPLGRHVLHEAARHYRQLVDAGLPRLRISVNVSAAQFNDDLYRDIEAVVREFDMPEGLLELELTESVVMQSPERAIELMQRLGALGVCFSIDDFGTGYSSLAYLKRFPIERLKIDRSFVQDLDRNSQDAAICQSIIGLARSLGIATVAEGVETEAQQRWLREHGCNELQGFLLGRPQAFEALLPELIASKAAHAT